MYFEDYNLTRPDMYNGLSPSLFIKPERRIHKYMGEIFYFTIKLHIFNIIASITTDNRAGQWLSGRVLDWRPRGRRFKPHRRHCIVVLEQDTFILA